MLLFFSLTYTALTLAQENGQVTVENLEKEALAHRRSLVRGFVAIERKQVVKPRPDLRDGDTVRVWFDGNRMRQDVLRHDSGKNEIPVREVNCLGCECDDCELSYIQAPPGRPLVAVQLDKKQKRNTPFVQVDPRRLGFVPFPLFGTWRNHLEVVVGAPERKNCRIQKTTSKGKNLWLLEYTGMRNERVRIWICPELGYNVTRMVLEGISVRGKMPWKTTVESRIGQWGAKKIWYPSSYTYVQEVGGKEYNREEGRVIQASFNEAMDPKVFRLSGLELPEGIMITGSAVKRPAVGKEKVWLNGKITERTIKAAPVPEAKREPHTFRWWAVVVSVIAAAFAAAAAWHLFATKSQAGEP